MCRRLMSKRKKIVVLGLGGFASGPAMMVAAKSQFPVGMLNPDAVPGRANRFGRKYADKIFLQWQESVKYFKADSKKCVVSGCPIRESFVGVRPGKVYAKQQLGLDGDKRVLVVMGGSQGGHNVNEAVIRCLTCGRENSVVKRMPSQWQVLHITGQEDWVRVKQEYGNAGINAKVLHFTKQMDMVLASADLVIGRAGASSLAELTAVGLATILLPYPYHKDNHQLRNAQVLEKAGAARIVIDDCNTESTAERLEKVLEECIKEDTTQQMGLSAKTIAKPDAAAAVVIELKKLLVEQIVSVVD